MDNFMYYGNPSPQLLRIGLDGTGRTTLAHGSYADVDHREGVLYTNGVGQIDKFSLSGSWLGRFALTSGTSPRQAAFMEDGTMLAAVRPNKLYHFGSDGQLIRLLNLTVPTSVTGAQILASGFWLVSAMAGIYLTDPATGSSTQIISSSAGYLTRLDLWLVSGLVQLEDYPPGPNGYDVEFELFDPSGPSEFHNYELKPDGGFAHLTPKSGFVALRVRAPRFLTKQVSFDLGTSGITNLSISLTNGDVDGDNEVGIGDYAIVSQVYGTTRTDPGWFEYADLNGDGEVDIGDYAILSANYGEVGD